MSYNSIDSNIILLKVRIVYLINLLFLFFSIDYWYPILYNKIIEFES